MADRPNFLLFIPDGMQAQIALPDHQCQTPNFQRVSERGLQFRRAHTSLPTCSPARASLMTGLMPHNHGVLQVEHCVDDDQSVLRTEHPHWAQRLSDAGYRTGYFGKWHIERTNDLEQFGWQVNGCDKASAYRKLGAGVENKESLLNDNAITGYKTGPDGYNDVLHFGVTDVPTERRDFARITDMACDFLDEALQSDQPFATVVSFSEPNTPLICGREAYEKYNVDDIELPANLHDTYEGKPAFYRRHRDIYANISDRQWRQSRAAYYALIGEIDQQLGRLLDKLEAADTLDNTIVIVMSDHGRYMGAHGCDEHNFAPFEEAYNIPLIIAGPDVAKGEMTEAIVGLADICPTLLELAGAEPIDVPDSRSFAPLLRDPKSREGDFDRCFAEFFGTRFIMTQRVLWQGDWKFVFNGFDYDELYNLKDDPNELTNLANDPAQIDHMKSMMAEMWRIMHATNDRALLETHYAPMRIGIVGPNAGLAKE
jgi:arylsulfatase A-like enzyme